MDDHSRDHTTTWDPATYARFADHRSRPYADLLARIGHPSPRLVVDLGCGNGPLTLSLARRWHGARIVGVDSSPQMLESARSLDTEGRVEWVQADVSAWDPAGLRDRVDVFITNATLQWVPGHLDLLPRWASALADGGWFAMQVPSNFDAPSHRLIREVAERHPRAADLAPGLRRANAVAEIGSYIGALSRLGLTVDAWETVYQHILDPEGEQESPVLEWVRSTGLRPVLNVLTDEAERADFLAAYAVELAAHYPRQSFGTVFPFRRIFAVGHRGPLQTGEPA